MCDIKMDLKETGWGVCGLDSPLSVGTGDGLVWTQYELSVSIKWGWGISLLAEKLVAFQ